MNNSSSFFDKVAGLCWSFLFGATAIYIAVELIVSIWQTLLLIVAIGALIAIAIVGLTYVQRRRW